MEDIVKMSNKELEKVKKEFHSQLKPLFDSVDKTKTYTTSRNYRMFRQNLLELVPRLEKMKQIYGFMTHSLGHHVNAPDEEPPTIAESSASDFEFAFLYLGIVEMGGNLLADLVITYLIATGHDFHLECAYRTPRIKHLTSLKELEEERVPLATKLNFIEDCGITIFKSIIDTQLRNDIAHMKFEIKGNTVYIRGKPAVFRIYDCLTKMRTALAEHISLEKKAKAEADACRERTKKAMSNHESNSKTA
jgi:hypothetical protein